MIFNTWFLYSQRREENQNGEGTTASKQRWLPETNAATNGTQTWCLHVNNHVFNIIDRYLMPLSYRYKTMSGSSQYRFGVLAKIVKFMRTRHQDGDDHPLSIEEILDETNQLDIGQSVKNVSNPSRKRTRRSRRSPYLDKSCSASLRKQGLWVLFLHQDYNLLKFIYLSVASWWGTEQ